MENDLFFVIAEITLSVSFTSVTMDEIERHAIDDIFSTLEEFKNLKSIRKVSPVN